MHFNTFDFLLFFIPLFLLLSVLPSRRGNRFLLLASYLFYCFWDWRFLTLILVTTLVDYSCALKIGRSEHHGERKNYVLLSGLVNFVLLAYFKYANFFIDSAVRLLELVGFRSEGFHLDIVLPLGISFYTFKSFGYVMDVYRGKARPEQSLWNYALFVAFFTQLIAGPIERITGFGKQLKKKPGLTADRFYGGCWLIFWGLFKKSVIADNLKSVVDPLFSVAPSTLSCGQVLLAGYGYAFQIYADFSGYCDMAIGLSMLLGYELSINFRLPYFALNPQDFWRRWHITLSEWFRDYVYVPMGGSRTLCANVGETPTPC